MDLTDIQHLAILARLDISQDEAQGLLADLQAIIAYVDQVKNATVSGSEIDVPQHRNVARPDVAYNTSGEFTEVIMQNVPSKQDGFVKVNKILND